MGGLGAQRVKKDFAELEREAEMADQVRTKRQEEEREKSAKSAAEEEKSFTSMRMAYQDLSVEAKKTVSC